MNTTVDTNPKMKLTSSDDSERNSEQFQVEVRHSIDTASIMKQWKQLENKLQPVPLMCSSEWTQKWLEAYGDVVPYRFLIGKKNEEIKGICLLTEGVGHKTGPFKIRSLHLGTAGERDSESVCVEYNDILVEPEFRSEFINEILGNIFEDSSWDEFCLDGFSEKSISDFLNSSDHFQKREVASYYYDFSKAGDEETISQFGYSTRKNLRKNFKKYGEIKTEWAETIEQAESIYADLIRLHQDRWTASGETGSYASTRFTEFHRDLIKLWTKEGKIGLLRVSDEEGVIGCVQLFVDRNRALVYQGGQVVEKSKRSPGVVTDYYCMEECRKRGLAAYDFLGGDSHHKQKLTTDSATLVWAKLRRPRLKYYITDVARKIRNSIPKQF